MSGALVRARLLLQTRRFAEAEPLLASAILEDPDAFEPRWLHGLCLLAQDRLDAAEQVAGELLARAPEHAEAHAFRARVMAERRRFADAIAAAEEAIRLDPEDPDHRELRAELACLQEDWTACLRHAEAGLELDPESTDCLNLRSQALLHLGRREEAGAALQESLARDPDNARTHAARGWELLHASQPDAARVHFREALRLAPDLHWAQRGLVEAIKARNPFYRLLLRYFLGMSRLNARARWGVIIGLLVLFRVARATAAAQSDLNPFLQPVIYAYFAFVASTWLGRPVANLVLLASRDGRHALDREDRSEARALGVCLFVSLVVLVAWAISRRFDLGLLAGWCLTLTVPLTSIFQCAVGWPRRVMKGITTVLLGAGLLGIAMLFDLVGEDLAPAGAQLLMFALACNLISTWVGGFLITRVPRR